MLTALAKAGVSRRATALLAAGLTATMLTGCYEIPSAVPALAADAAAPALRPRPGRFCAIDETQVEDGAASIGTVDDCLTVALQGGRLIFRDVAEADPPLEFVVAPLGRGVSLLQTAIDDKPGFLFYMALLRDDAFAILPPPRIGPAALRAAEGRGIRLLVHETAERTLAARKAGFTIAAGESDAVLAFMRWVNGRTLDAALRDEVLLQRLAGEAAHFVRSDEERRRDERSGAPRREPATAVERARREALRQALVRAILLE